MVRYYHVLIVVTRKEGLLCQQTQKTKGMYGEAEQVRSVRRHLRDREQVHLQGSGRIRLGA